MLPLASSALALLLLRTVTALGDFPCAGAPGSQSCAAWAVDPNRQGDISPTAACTPDPVNPNVSYCGYANSPCTTGLDCDYGSCGPNGVCAGFIGDACPNGSSDCQAFFFCGADATCGGAGGDCNNTIPAIPMPDQQCTSGSCNSAAMTCNPGPVAGEPVGSGCGNDAVCASRFCSPAFTCQVRVVAPVPSAGAGAAAKKRKRFLSGGEEVSECPRGSTACPLSGWFSQGFECIDSKSNLEQCGGCVSSGEGKDCAAIPGVEGVLCQGGHCLILSCRPGLELSLNGHACVARS